MFMHSERTHQLTIEMTAETHQLAMTIQNRNGTTPMQN